MFDISKIFVKKESQQNTTRQNAINIIVINTELLMKDYLDNIKKELLDSLPSILENSRQVYILSCNSITHHISLFPIWTPKDPTISEPTNGVYINEERLNWIKNIRAGGMLDIRKTFMHIKNICEKSIIKYVNNTKFNILFISTSLPFFSTRNNKRELFYLQSELPCDKSNSDIERASKRFSSFLKQYDTIVNVINLDDDNSNFLTSMGKKRGVFKNVKNQIEMTISLNEILNIRGYTSNQIIIIVPYLILSLLRTIVTKQQNNHYKISNSLIIQLLTLIKCMYQIKQTNLVSCCENKKDYNIHDFISLLFVEGFGMLDKDKLVEHDFVWNDIISGEEYIYKYLQKKDLIIIRNFLNFIENTGGLKNLIIEWDNNGVNDVIKILFDHLDLINLNILI